MQESTKKNYDSDFCGNVPLHLINSIQPYGLLVVLEKSSLQIIQVSENAQDLFGKSTADLLNKNFLSFITENESANLQQKLAYENIRQGIPLTFNFLGAPCLAIAHFKDKLILLEIEKKDANAVDFSSTYHDVKYIVAVLKNAQSTEEVCHIAAKEIKKLSNFDKVIFYSFDQDWNGIVIAEEKEEDMDSYMGLRFPASDVPKQARELYLRNPYRLIPDSSYVPAKLYPTLNPLTFTFTDLTDCNLRGVPAVHLEYLSNMKVGASMSTPIVKDDKLWGLITCHHKKPREVSYDLRNAFELLSTIVSAQLSAKEKERRLLHSSKLDTIQSRLYKQMVAANNFVEGIFQPETTLLELLETQGVALSYQGTLKTAGDVPPDNFIKEINFWLKINNIEKVFHTDSIYHTLGLKAENQTTASGFIAIPIAPSKGDYLLGFRPEIIKTVTWGGNPNDAIQFEPDKKNYHPRNSFESWKETVRGTSEQWQEGTVAAAEDLQKSILEMMWRNKVS